jgi:hypothetical protein
VVSANRGLVGTEGSGLDRVREVMQGLETEKQELEGEWVAYRPTRIPGKLSVCGVRVSFCVRFATF